MSRESTYLKLSLLIFVVAAFAVTAAAYFIYAHLVKRDFDRICEVFSSSFEIGNSKDARERQFEMSKKLEMSLLTSPAKHAFASMGQAPYPQRSTLLQLSAVDAGYKNWNCPAIEKYFDETSNK